MARVQCALTTIDNPYNPFDQFSEWYAFDMEKGYDCCGKLARLSYFSEEMTEIEILQETERAIDRIIELDISDLYTKVTKPLKDIAENDIEEI